MVFSHFVLRAGSRRFMLENKSIYKPALSEIIFTKISSVERPESVLVPVHQPA